jgi:hypothetical protein
MLTLVPLRLTLEPWWLIHLKFLMKLSIYQRWAHATFLQLEGSTSAIAIPQLFKEMLLHNRNYFAIKFFSEVRNFEALLPQFLAWGIWSNHEKKYWR